MMIQEQDESNRRLPLNRQRFKDIFIILLLSILLFRFPNRYPRPLTIQTKDKHGGIPMEITMEKGQDDKTLWRDYDQLQTSNLTMTIPLGSRIARTRQYHSANTVMQKVNLTPGTLGKISPVSPVVLLKGPHGTPGSDDCPFLTNNMGATADSSPRPLSYGEFPGYTGWYRPHSPVLNWYRPIHFGSRPLLLGERTDSVPKYVLPQSKDGKLQYHGTRHEGTPMLRHQLYHNFSSGQSQSTTILPWTTVVLCPFIQCQGNGKDIPRIHSQFYARAYGPSILAGRVTKVPVDHVPTSIFDGVRNDSDHQDSSIMMMAYEIAFHFRNPGIYTVEVVLEQGDA